MPRTPRWARSRLWSPLRSRRLWRGVLAAAACLVVLAVAFRQPLSDWIWPETRIQQLLGRAEAALAQGRLTASDGSGATELFDAALALDADRDEARDGLARTGLAAVAQARAALAAGRPGDASRALSLAQALQVPQSRVGPLLEQLRQARVHGAGLDRLLAQAAQARSEARLDGTPDSALPLYQRILQLAPERTEALEGREDALSDLIQQAWVALCRDDIAAAAPILTAARGYDPGHADLPAAQAEFNRLLEQHRRTAELQLQRGRLDAAARGFQRLVQAQPDDMRARDDLARVATALATQATRDAADFRFQAADAALARARGLDPENPAIAAAGQALARARATHDTRHPGLAPAERERRLRALMLQVQRAETAQDWLTPPGASAYDKLREAQAIAPQDKRVLHALRRIVATTRACFEDELSGNHLRAARICLDAWQATATRDAGVAAARRRLAQRWIAVGSERLRAEDVAFARQALAEARALDPAAPELSAFAEQVEAAALR
ncbi:MAG: hypothetical protein QM581_09495 [Pseudomonas sp.]